MESSVCEILADMAGCAPGFAKEQLVTFLHFRRHGGFIFAALPLIPRRVATDSGPLIIGDGLANLLFLYFIHSKSLPEIRTISICLESLDHRVVRAPHGLGIR